MQKFGFWVHTFEQRFQWIFFCNWQKSLFSLSCKLLQADSRKKKILQLARESFTVPHQVCSMAVRSALRLIRLQSPKQPEIFTPYFQIAHRWLSHKDACSYCSVIRKCREASERKQRESAEHANMPLLQKHCRGREEKRGREERREGEEGDHALTAH